MPDSRAVANPSDRPLEHDWWDPGEKYPRLRVWTEAGVLMSCRRCGIVKGRVSSTKPCPGDVKVELRG